MLDHGRELIAKAERDKLLRQIEEGLAHSREIIAQVNEVIAQINELRAQRRANFRRVGANDFRF